MPNYQYIGKVAGNKSDGWIEAPDKKQAIRKLQSQGIVLIRIQEATVGPKKPSTSQGVNLQKDEHTPANRVRLFSFRTSNKKLAIPLAKRLLELHSGGLPLGDAVHMLSIRLTNPAMKQVTMEIWNHLREGKGFGWSVAQIPNLYPPTVHHLLDAGEASGDMVSVLENIIEYLEERERIKKQVISSLTYPVFLMVLVFGILTAFIFVLLPRITSMIEAMGGEMNFFTLALVTFAEYLIKFGPIIGIAVIVSILLISQWRKSETGRTTTDRLLYKIPLIGNISSLSTLYQMSKLMNTLMDSGINTSENLKLTERTLLNQWLKKRFNAARTMINEGASFSNAFRNHQLYPDSAIDILSVGENTGNLSKGLKEITRNVREILDAKLHFLTVFVSSSFMAIAFIFVLFAALGMVLSVLEVSRTISLQ